MSIDTKVEIVPSQIPPLELRLLCASFLEAALRFYENPANMESFERWRNGLKGGLAHGEAVVTHLRQENSRCYAPKDGDFERWPERVFVNYACDLLKFVYFFSAMRSLQHARETLSVPTELQYTIVCHKTDYPILRIYPDLLDEKGLNIGVFNDE